MSQTIEEAVKHAGWLSISAPSAELCNYGKKKKKKKRNDSDHMFTLHPREPAAQIILKSSLRFAPTSLTLAAEACSPTIHQG